MSDLYLGLDGGGTKTAALLMDGDGNILGRGEGGPGNIIHTPDNILKRSVMDSVKQACANASVESESCHFNRVCAAMAGYSDELRRDSFLGILHNTLNSKAIRVEPDYVAAFWGATHGSPGIVVVAGTGAIAYGRNDQGKSWREDGLGFLLGDRGSGFNLGLRTLRHTLEKMQEGKLDRLSEAVIEHTGAESQNHILQWLYSDFQPAKVATLAPVVGQLADSGDEAACYHLAVMARRLRHSVRQVRHNLWLSRESPVYTLGGLWKVSRFLVSEFTEPCWQPSSGLQIEPDPLPAGSFHIADPLSEPVYGAAFLALNQECANIA